LDRTRTEYCPLLYRRISWFLSPYRTHGSQLLVSVPMQYDEVFLGQRHLLEDPQSVEASLGGEIVTCFYDKIARLVFLRLPIRIRIETAVAHLASQMLFDYAWILGTNLTVIRTFGHRRYFRLTPEEAVDPDCAKVRLLDEMTHSTLHTLFESSGEMSGLLSRLVELRSAIADDSGTGLPEPESIVCAQKLIDRLCFMLFTESHRGSHGTYLESLLKDDGAARRIMEDLNALGHDAFERTGFLEFMARRSGNARFSQAVTSLIQILAEYDWDLDPWKDSPRAMTPKLVEVIHEKMVVPLVNLMQNRMTASRDPRRLSRPNRQTGSFYTPDHVAHYIASRAIAGWIQDATGIDVYTPGLLGSLDVAHRVELLSAIDRVKILDLACGSGVLLRSAADWLLHLTRMLSSDHDEERNRQRIVETNLYGVDLLDSAVETCRSVLAIWAGAGGANENGLDRVAPLVRQGNSLISTAEMQGVSSQTVAPSPFCWRTEFPAAFDTDHPGFDVVISNPPYGSILGSEEKRFLQDNRIETTNGGRNGSWSAAAQFIAKSRTLLNAEGWFGLIVPNSILRVRQFEKTRKFLTGSSQIVEVVDEGSPFENITLETVSIFGRARRNDSCKQVQVLSRRSDLPRMSTVRSSGAMTERMFILYFDELIESLMMRGSEAQISATRGRDLGAEHISRRSSQDFDTPYATKGKSVQHYRIDTGHLIYADTSFLSDRVLRESYENEFLIATKNLPYPRCGMKPRGMIHGGGTVKLKFARRGSCQRTMGVILNSELIRYLSVRYFTNYSQLTTCLNTGIMESLPIVYPKHTEPFSALFDALTSLRTEANLHRQSGFDRLNRLANALVYELYLSDETELQDAMHLALEEDGLIDRVARLPEVREAADSLYGTSQVKRILSSPRMAPTVAPVSQMPMLI